MTNYFQKIMIIDDDSIDRLLLNKILMKAGLAGEIIEADSWLKALDILTAASMKHEQFPELIFLDVNMAAMDGFQFLDVFTQLSRDYSSRCRIVLVSSIDNEPDRKKGLKYECVAGYYLKPLNIEILLQLKENLRHTNVS